VLNTGVCVYQAPLPAPGGPMPAALSCGVVACGSAGLHRLGAARALYACTRAATASSTAAREHVYILKREGRGEVGLRACDVWRVIDWLPVVRVGKADVFSYVSCPY